MMRAALLVLALSLPALLHAAPLDHSGLDTSRLPTEFFRTWRVVGPASKETTLPISFAVKLDAASETALANKFASVSDPRNADYGNYWTPQELRSFVFPAPRSLAAVRVWLKESGVEASTVAGFVRADLDVASAERLLGVTFFEFQHLVKSNVRIVRATAQPTLPAAVRAHIDFVAGVNNMPVVADPTQHSVELAPKVTPKTLRELYGVSDVASSNSSASQALAEFQGQNYSPSDLKHFLEKYKLPAQTVRTDTGKKPGLLGHTEANLDVQYIMVTGQGIPTDFYLSSGMSFDLIGWITAVQQAKEADVWSVSYGEDLSAVTTDYAQRLDKEFQQIATLGASVIFASGDSGVYSRTGGTTKFHPSFPACLPSVTSVGATQLDTPTTEKSSTKWSGGGFSLSNYFTQPSYQADAVNHYMTTAKDLPPAAMYDGKGRGFPDVSANGLNYEVVLDHLTLAVSGTSASCPTFAGIVALLNDQRLQQGKSKLGFLNPFLYQNEAAFNDITEGCNNNGEKQGFCAAPGWDPVTGLGTPNYSKLKAAALA